jgi:hypothetical protein
VTAEEREMVSALTRRARYLERCLDQSDRRGRVFDVLELTALQWVLRVVYTVDEHGLLERLGAE